MNPLFLTHHVVDLALRQNKSASMQLADLDRMYDMLTKQQFQPNTILMSPRGYSEAIAFNNNEQVELCQKFEPHITSMMLS